MRLGGGYKRDLMVYCIDDVDFCWSYRELFLCILELDTFKAVTKILKKVEIPPNGEQINLKKVMEFEKCVSN